ncbi:MAG TPA: ATP-binding protein [Chthoniobacteraceae bacterium]
MSGHSALATDQLRRVLEELASERAAKWKLQTELVAAREQFSQLQRRENYFRNLTEYALDLITILDADGTIRFESRSITTELGYAPEDYIGKNAFDFLHPEDSPRVMQAFVSAMQTQGSTPVLSFRFRHKDGSYRILEGRGNNLLNDPAVRGIVFNSRDITERRRLEEQFQQSQKVQAIGQLTGGVAHDFNNILTAIIGFSDLTLDLLEEDTQPHSNLQEIRRAADRAAALTRQLLAFSRKQILQPSVANLGSIIADMDKMLRRVLGGNIDFLTLTSEDVGNVEVDLSQMQQVLLNLAVNARDAMAESGKLTIETANVTIDERHSELYEVAPGDYVLLAISDTGCGMPPEVKARIFEPFFTTKDAGQGTGLGLATCHGIVKQSGGHIAVYSEVGKGTTFRVYLPRVDAPVFVPEEPVAIRSAPSGTETVLLVEDEPMLRELGQMVLEDLGYRVLAAENGCEALRLLAQNEPVVIHLLLTDVVMPVMGGKELAAKLRPISPQTKIIFCSGYTEDAIFHSGGLEAGVYFLQKPYSVAAVAQKVRDVLNAA